MSVKELMKQIVSFKGKYSVFKVFLWLADYDMHEGVQARFNVEISFRCSDDNPISCIHTIGKTPKAALRAAYQELCSQ
jgi:hypothetical protein